MLSALFDHRHRGNAGIREHLSQLFTLMKLDAAADRMRNILISGCIPGSFFFFYFIQKSEVFLQNLIGRV